MTNKDKHRGVSGRGVARKYRFLSAANLAVALVVAVLVAAFSGNLAANDARQKLLKDAGETLAVQTETLTGLLDRYRLVSSLLSRRPETAEIFASHDVETARNIARQVAGASGALDVIYLNTDGSILSTGIDLVHDNIPADSQLITTALQGRLGRAVRLLKNGSLAYVFTSGTLSNGKFTGIIAVYVSLAEIQSAWSLSTNPILASSQNGLVIISNRLDWQQKPLGSIKKIQNGEIFVPTPRGERRHLETSRELPLLGWTLSVLADASPVESARAFWAGLSFLAVAALAIAVQTLINRQDYVIRRQRTDRATALQLERIVRDRTRDLSKTNLSLQSEIEERKSAEDRLRTTQAELVQTGKMAALGQMSTSLAHEYNQPLSAIKSYADNALTYLDRDRAGEARQNIALISTLTDRMAEISSHLRNFARRPNPDFGTAVIDDVIKDALTVLAPRLRTENAVINITQTDAKITARAGHVRMQQVLVNLVLNALDAMKDQADAALTIATSQHKGKVKITVTDNGPGIDKQAIETIFDPFVTTKPVGQGLGLGLSISYNIIKDFGGQLHVQNTAAGGAEFTITLHMAKLPSKLTPTTARQPNPKAAE